MDLGLDDENAEKKLKQIVYEEERRVKDFLETTNKTILKKECDAGPFIFEIREYHQSSKKRFSSHSSKKGYKTSAKAGMKGSNSI